MAKKEEKWSVKQFALFLHNMVRTDRQGLFGVSGETGTGKSTCLAKIFHEYGKLNGVGWSFTNMTWSRDELMEWIDGVKDSTPNPATGLKEKQLPEYSGIMADELLPMFYSGNRFDDEQKKAGATFNMCRDRHLLVGGAIPTFWDLDNILRKRLMFYIFIPQRGVAWVFEKENNPFAKDPWNTQYNEKCFRLYAGKPWYSPNYLCTIHFDDWEGNLREEYYSIRNKKRIQSLSSMEKKAVEKKVTHKKSILAFGNLVNNLKADGMSYVKIAEYAKVSDTTVSSWSNIALEAFGKYENSEK